jgi:polysaccharide biosynthesis/export protein
MTMRICLALFCLSSIIAVGAHAEGEYLIGPGDGLSVSVWERPELTRNVIVRQSGAITYPPLGDVAAAGVTSADLARDLEQRLNDFLRRPTQVTVEVVAFNSQYVTVVGAVGAPGRYSFERLPGMLEVLGSAGGAAPGADISGVQLYRNEGGVQKSIPVNLATAMQEGKLEAVPGLKAGDVIYVPGTSMENAGGANVAYVIGDVARPGAYSVGSGMDLMKVVSLAGGTLAGAKLSGVEVIARPAEGSTAFVATVDLKRYLEGTQAEFVVRPGDVVRVPTKDRSVAGDVLSTTVGLATLTQSILNSLLISGLVQINNN